MRGPALVAVALVVLSVVAPATATPAVAATTAAGIDESTTNSTADAGTTHRSDPADPAEDVLGWENGYWYNESIAVTPADGLNDSELEAVVARSMARVEEIRRLEFEGDVPVEIVSREAFRRGDSAGFGNVSVGDRLHQNVKYEALYMVNESTDAVSVQESNLGASVGGFYSPAEQRIVIVSENATSPQLSEVTLSQELFHALQDQKYNLSSYNQSTREQHNSIDGIVEGDGNYVDYLYQQRCAMEQESEGYWGNCLQDTARNGSGGTAQLANIGLYLLVFQPYSDGPPFVESIRQAGGWEAVNAVYEDPPASTEHTIHPDTYDEDPPVNVSIEDRSNETWTPLDVPNAIDYAEFGEAGVFSMFVYPTFASQGQTQIVPANSFLNRDGAGNPDPLDPYNYSSRYSAGWDGDKLLPYVTEDSATTNETGYVWKLAWDTPEDADEFVTGYRQLMEYRGAERVGENTYVLPDGGGYGDAVHVVTGENRTTVVNAPTLDALPAVDDRVEVQPVENGSGAGNDTSAGGAAENATAAGDGTSADGDGSGNATDSSSGTGPGFGVVAAVLALLGAALLAGARTRRE
jgi:PGF-CTERM protein